MTPAKTLSLPEPLSSDVRSVLEDWRRGGNVRRLWEGDASLWTGADEGRWLGWLGAVDEGRARLRDLGAFAGEVRAAGFRHALLLGMGGSSLCPEVLRATFGVRPGSPDLRVLDSTDPAQVRAREAEVDLDRTLFIVSSKSGTTLEPNIFKEYFFDGVARRAGDREAGRRFVAITDPRSPLEAIATRDRFLRAFPGRPDIGGRYSALSNFGLVPAAIMGLDLETLLERARRMAGACGPEVAPGDNPGVLLGAVLGVAGRSGRDKVTLVASPGIAALGGWLEQLLAESTGKRGKGLIPVDGEALGPPAVYGDDRLFVYARLAGAPDPSQDAALEAIARAGHPVVRIDVTDRLDIGAEFFRWEIATAVAGSILGINPFDQPDVEASKIATRALTDEYERRGALPAESPVLESGGLRLYADETNARTVAAAAGGAVTAGAWLRAHLDRIGRGDYCAFLAYLPMNDATRGELQAARHRVRDLKRSATCLGFGPRFLHSTGQAYKGGPNSGVFLQITCDDGADLPVPGRRYTFGVVKEAQARGDFRVLAERGRRALRVHLAGDVRRGLGGLRAAIDEALHL